MWVKLKMMHLLCWQICDLSVASLQSIVKSAVAMIGTLKAISWPAVSANKRNAKFTLLAINAIAIPTI